MGLSSFSFFSGGLHKTFYIYKSDVSAVQGHWFCYQWKVRMWLPISPS